MKVLGISALNHDATASLVQDGRLLFAAAEERFSRVKLHAGFPWRAIEAALKATGTDPAEIEVVAYPFFTWDQETELLRRCLAEEAEFQERFREPDLQSVLAEAEARVPRRTGRVRGLESPNQKMDKGWLKELLYRLAGGSRVVSRRVALHASREWARRASADHRRCQEELEAGLAKLGLLEKLRRSEHHFSHATNGYLASGFDRALVVTVDGYGSGLAGSISLGENGKLTRLHDLRFPHSLGMFYQSVTSSLGFEPDRHAGKTLGLAAYGDPAVLAEAILARVERRPGDFKLLENLNVYFSRHLAVRFPMVDLAAAWQHVLEVLMLSLVRYWAHETKCGDVALSGGVAANVKMNQRIHEMAEVEQIFIYPTMGDGGGGTGLAMFWSWPGGVGAPIRDAYHGPSYTSGEIRAALEHAGVAYAAPRNLAFEVARRLDRGQVIGRFDGRMEYGPRALGNRTILCHARDPEVNRWLNRRLDRTEFMPFAPVTLWEARDRCYLKLAGAEHAAQFMTITLDCTDWMKENCPAAVHVDGTARPQLIKREINPGYYDIVKEYERLSGIPCLINTSFNMHEEPIVCSPYDAVRAFLQADLDGLAIGPYFVPHPARCSEGRSLAP